MRKCECQSLWHYHVRNRTQLKIEFRPWGLLRTSFPPFDYDNNKDLIKSAVGGELRPQTGGRINCNLICRLGARKFQNLFAIKYGRHQNYALQFLWTKSDPAGTGVAKRFLLGRAKKGNRDRAQSDTNRVSFL